MAPKPPPIPPLPQFSTELSLAQKERLALLIEECGEVIQAATKVLRHGYESQNPFIVGQFTNRMDLNKELGHLLFAAELMLSEADIDKEAIEAYAQSKSHSIWQWLHFQNPKVRR